MNEYRITDLNVGMKEQFSYTVTSDKLDQDKRIKIYGVLL